ncbi:MAG: 50S ribosomal protein L19 [Candidatus Nealsonbacteria bacterium]
MTTKLENFNAIQINKELPDIKPGDTIKVYQKIKEKDKERLQVFEGQVLARKHGKGISSTITVRKVTKGIGVEKIFPVHSPVIDRIELVKRSKIRRAKLYYLREAKGRRARLKQKAIKKTETDSVSPSEEISMETTEGTKEE